MAEKRSKDRRSRLGFGSTYRKGSEQDLDQEREIQAVLGGQVWMVKPEKRAEATHPCLWMQAGVAKFKNCNNYYDCNTCKYDLGMHKQVEKGKQMSWQDAMRRVPDMDRVCRHSLTERIGHRLCAYNHECASCDFDQFFEDVWAAKTKTVPFEIQNVKGFDVPVGYYFHNGHAWARIESGGFIRIGLDDFALKLLGKADALDLPLMGNQLDPDKPGWVVRVHADNLRRDLKNLMIGNETKDFIGEEVDRLYRLIEDEAGPLAADGGQLGHDIYGNLPQIGWRRLVKKFLHT